MQVLGQCKGVISAVVSVLCFHNLVPTLGWFGYGVTVVGCIIYGRCKAKFRPQIKHPEAPSQPTATAGLEKWLLSTRVRAHSSPSPPAGRSPAPAAPRPPLPRLPQPGAGPRPLEPLQTSGSDSGRASPLDAAAVQRLAPYLGEPFVGRRGRPGEEVLKGGGAGDCLLYTSPSPRD